MLCKYIPRICVAFVVWSAFYAAVHFDGDIELFVTNVISGHYHMWYLYMIAAMYLSVPLLRKITESDTLIKYFLILSLIFTFLLKFIAMLPHMELIQTVVDKSSFNIAVGYTSYFVVGYYLNKSEISKHWRWIIYLSGMCSFAANVLFTHFFSVKAGVLYDGFYSYFSITVLLQSIAVFVFAKYNLSDFPKSTQRSNALLLMSELTFGIYLIHPYIIELLDRSRASDGTIGFMFIKIIISFIVSGAISYLLKRIPILSKAV